VRGAAESEGPVHAVAGKRKQALRAECVELVSPARTNSTLDPQARELVRYSAAPPVAAVARASAGPIRRLAPLGSRKARNRRDAHGLGGSSRAVLNPEEILERPMPATRSSVRSP
jgi:hypothetical protein